MKYRIEEHYRGVYPYYVVVNEEGLKVREFNTKIEAEYHIKLLEGNNERNI